MTPEASAVGRSCPKVVCHQQHKNPNNRPLCAPCQLQPGRDQGGGTMAVGTMGIVRAPPEEAAPRSPGRGPAAVTSSELPGKWQIWGALKKGVCPVGRSQDAGSGSECLLKVSLQRNPLPMLSWSLWRAGMHGWGKEGQDVQDAPMAALSVLLPAHTLTANAHGEGFSF